MLLNEFSQNYFKPAGEGQDQLMNRFLKMRALQGIPHRIRILRALAKTRHYTHSVYPPGWKFE